MPGGDAGRRTHDGDITRSCRFKAAPPGGGRAPPTPSVRLQLLLRPPRHRLLTKTPRDGVEKRNRSKKASGSGIDPLDSTLIRRSTRSDQRRNRESSVIWVKPRCGQGDSVIDGGRTADLVVRGPPASLLRFPVSCETLGRPQLLFTHQARRRSRWVNPSD
ncbi:unnamed protein product [Boreogadus saida]